MKIETAPNIAVLWLILYNIAMPISVSNMAIVNALFTDILPAGIGLFCVRSIKESKSFSMIWLYAFDAPTIQYPPIAKRINVFISTKLAPNKYPAREENTTLRESLNFVISLKLEMKETGAMEVCALFKLRFAQLSDQRYFIQLIWAILLLGKFYSW